MNKWLKYIKNVISDNALGISVNLIDNTNCNTDVVALNKKKGQIHVISSSTYLSLENALAVYSPTMPVYLSIEGKGVLHKIIKKNIKNDVDEYYLNQIIPNSSPKDFYLQKYEIDKEHYYCSLIKKEILGRLVGQIKVFKFYIINVVLGPFSIDTIYKFMEAPQEIISIPYYSISFVENKISNITRQDDGSEEKSFKIGQEKISSKSLVPYSSAILNYVSFSWRSSVYQSEKEEYSYNRKFIIGLFCIIALTLIILFTNSLLLSSFKNKHNFLNNIYVQNEKVISSLKSVEEKFEAKKVFFQSEQLLSPSEYSMYLDRLGSILPKNIVFEKLEIQPLKTKLTQDKEVRFVKDIIYIKGKTDHSTRLNNWIKALRKEEWVKDINILNYYENNKIGDNNFELNIAIN